MSIFSKKAFAMLEKVATLCRSHGFAIPLECTINNKALTCYNYGPPGSLFRKNIIKEWWDSLLINHRNIYTVQNGSLVHGVEGTNTGIRVSAFQDASDTSDGTDNEQVSLRQSLIKGMCEHYLSTLAMSAGRRQLPFGLAQQGFCWNIHKNNKSRHFLFSSNEYEELVLEYFVPPAQSDQAMDHWVQTRLEWWKQFSGAPSNFSTVDLEQESVQDAPGQEVQILYNFPWGKDTIETLRNFGDATIVRHQTQTGISHKAQNGRRAVIPHQIECTTTVEKAMLVFLLDAHTERQHHSTNTAGAGKKNNIVLQLHPRLAPYKIALLTSGSKWDNEGREVTGHVYKELRRAGITVMDLHSNMGMDSQLERYDEMGVPYVAIINDRTLETGIVQLRHRLTAIREKIALTDLRSRILTYCTTG